MTLSSYLNYRLIRADRKIRAEQPAAAPNLHQFQGLSQEEVAARRPATSTQENEQKARQGRRAIWLSRYVGIVATRLERS